MPTALDLFMSGMISNKSKEIGFSVDCFLVVDNALLDFETCNDDDCGPATQCSNIACSSSSSDSVAATVDTAETTTCQQVPLHHNNIDVSEDHISMLRWSASMGDRKALAELVAVEEHKAKRDAIEYENKLRWCATMGDTASLLKLNVASKNSRWSAGCAPEQKRKPVPSKRNLMQPIRRPSFIRLSKKQIPDEAESSKKSLVQPKRRPSFRLPKISLR